MTCDSDGYVGKLPRSYNPREFETDILRFWEENKIYERARSREGPKFYFLDGPPYPSSGTPHIGTAWNKIMKDSVIRFRRMRGYWVWDQPGYDTHGLPIEVAVEKKLGLKSKRDIEEKVGVERFIEECRRLAIENSESMSRHFWDIGVSMDWSNPYLTLHNSYIESSWWMIKRADEKGLLDRGVRVVWWCPRCETVLADYEVSEYTTLTDPSIYVKFPLVDGDSNLLIWTTTPWTLPANVFVMVHPDETYVEVEAEDGSKVILMEARLEPVFKDMKYKVVRKFKGSELVGKRYRHPLREYVDVQKTLDEYHMVVDAAEYVSREEGTGLVHAAPGHGEEDFMVGSKHGVPVVSPVDERGVYREEAGKYRGKYVFDANKEIIEDLKRDGYLFREERITHRYPICWRCKTRLIIRATEQWFIRVSQIKDELLDAIEKVDITPQWGYERFRNWLSELRDWVISRQRYWGIPLPIWRCTSCGSLKVVGSKKELEDSLVEGSLEDLHRPWIDRVKIRCGCGGVMERVKDVLDVWFDSGVAFYASLAYPAKEMPFKKLYPVDFITEGHDQVRGWFFSLLRAGVIGFDEAPYKKVQIHGFVLDEKGREMHKSLGNYVSPDEVVEKYGRDVLRYRLLQYTIWEDLRFSWSLMDLAFRELNILWNIYYFASLYMNLDRFTYKDNEIDKYLDVLRPEDKWILSRVNTVLKKYLGLMEKEYLHEAVRLVREFFLEDVSRMYIRLIRWRTWLEEADPVKLSAYSVLYYVLYRVLLMLAPITPFLTEKIYQDVFRPSSKELPESIHLLMLPDPDDELIDTRLEHLMEHVDKILEAGGYARSRAGIKIRIPVKRVVILSDDPDVKEAVDVYRDVLRSQLNVKEVVVEPLGNRGRYTVKKVSAKMNMLGPKYKGLAKRVAEEVESLPPEKVEVLLENGSITLDVDGAEAVVTVDDVEVSEEYMDRYVAREFEGGVLLLDKEVSEEELAMGLARDLVRRIQFMRKELDLPIDAYIDVVISAPDKQAVEMVKQHLQYIANETRAKKLEMDVDLEPPKDYYVKEWDVMGESYIIGIRLTTS